MDHNFSESLITRKEAVVSSKGIVASQHKLASRAGAKVLAEGGNAVDAAVATAFTVSVLEPWMSGIGGGGHMLIHDAPSGKVYAIDFGMRSPIGLDPEDYPLSGEGVASDLFPGPRLWRTATSSVQPRLRFRVRWTECVSHWKTSAAVPGKSPFNRRSRPRKQACRSTGTPPC